VKFPGSIWTVEIWTIKTGLGLGLGFLLGFGVMIGLELVFGLGLGLGLALVTTVQFMTVQIKTGSLPWPTAVDLKSDVTDDRILYIIFAKVCLYALTLYPARADCPAASLRLIYLVSPAVGS